MCYNSDGSGYLGGIVSWGIGCGGLFHPGVYTEVMLSSLHELFTFMQVSYFVDWVNQHMGGQ